MVEQDHGDPWGLVSSVMVEVEDYLDKLETGMAALDKQEAMKALPINARGLHPSPKSTAESLGVLTHRHMCYLRLVCGVRNGP